MHSHSEHESTALARSSRETINTTASIFDNLLADSEAHADSISIIELICATSVMAYLSEQTKKLL